MAAARRPEAGPSVHLIAGGLPKGDDPGCVREVLSRNVKRVYLIGRCATALENAWRGSVPCEVCGTLERAVELAADRVAPGECVLLSPGAASFDQFRSYGERGDRFAAMARAMRPGA